MVTIVVVIHLLITVVMIGLILLQKTEGGAAGAGFSPSASVESMMRPRARPNPIGRATAVLGVCFFATCIGLALLAKPATRGAQSIMLQAPASGAPTVPKVQDEPAPAPNAATPAVPSVPTDPSGAPTVPNK